MGNYWNVFCGRVGVLLRDTGQFILLTVERTVLLILLAVCFIVITIVAIGDWFYGRYA